MRQQRLRLVSARPMPRGRRNLPWHQSYGAWNNRLRPQSRGFVSFRCQAVNMLIIRVFSGVLLDVDGVKSDVGFFLMVGSQFSTLSPN